MKWSLKLGKLLGIDVHLHFTFLLLLAFLGFVYWRATQNVEAALRGVAFIIALFACVVLHGWPTRALPEVMGGGAGTLRELIREYLFMSLFRACAESLASENASRLAAMERADKNIELLENLHGTFRR